MTTEAKTREQEPDLLSLVGMGQAFVAAYQTGLLEALLVTPGTAAELATRLGLNTRAVEVVLGVLRAGGLVKRTGETYRATAGFSGMAQTIPGGLTGLFRLMEHTGTFLRTGEPMSRMDAGPAEREASYRALAGGLGRMFARAADALAEQLPLQPATILDVGCGSGVWSLAIAKRVPGARVTGLDFPGVLEESFAPRAEELGLADRIDKLPGDMHAVALPQAAFDLVIIANVLRLDPADRARSLLLRLGQAVRPGGHLLVVDALAAGTRAAEMARASYALHLALRTAASKPHPPPVVRAWMAEAGVVDLTSVECDMRGGALGALLGRRP
ncbi:MAG TPA: class I SAM-dependent methyltransferase [Longimicrobium sp.]|nr:class I SAM-dependent methyltransferase [Longimicrobium sp.]